MRGRFILSCAFSIAVAGSGCAEIPIGFLFEVEIPSDVYLSAPLELKDVDTDGVMDLYFRGTSAKTAYSIDGDSTIIAFRAAPDTIPTRYTECHLDDDGILDFIEGFVTDSTVSPVLKVVKYFSSTAYAEPDTVELVNLSDQDWRILYLYPGDQDNDGSPELYGEVIWTYEYLDWMYNWVVIVHDSAFGFRLTSGSPIEEPHPIDTLGFDHYLDLYGQGDSNLVLVHHTSSGGCGHGDVCTYRATAHVGVYDMFGKTIDHEIECMYSCFAMGHWSTAIAEIQSYWLGDLNASSDGFEMAANILHSASRTYQGTPDPSCRQSSRHLVMFDLSSPDTVIELWSVGFPAVQSYVGTFTDDRYPDAFFVRSFDYGDELDIFYLVNSSNGEIIDQTSLIDLGHETIGYASLTSGGDPMLIVQHGRRFRFFGLNIATDVEDDEPAVVLPSSFELGSPYPNPFNSTVSVPLTVGRKGRLVVTVHNVLGQKMATLFEGVAEMGTEGLTWEAHNASSGVYFIKATVENETATVKAVLLK